MPGAIAGFALVYYFSDNLHYLPDTISVLGSQGLVYKEFLGMGIGGFLNTLYWRWRANVVEVAKRRESFRSKIQGLEDMLR